MFRPPKSNLVIKEEPKTSEKTSKELEVDESKEAMLKNK